MVPKAIFHRLVQQDMSEILHYYSEEAPAAVGDRFFETFLQVAEKALLHPGLFHPISPALRRGSSGVSLSLPLPGNRFRYPRVSPASRSEAPRLRLKPPIIKSSAGVRIVDDYWIPRHVPRSASRTCVISYRALIDTDFVKANGPVLN